ncbi:MAG: FAD-dependent oxidoreductase [Acholeplasmataceae bacterium]|nr:FAD-dependent oxidoreductase [Acholeplasmataceae bacterium]
MFDFVLDPQVKKQPIELLALYDVIIIGAGPGGLNAALYAKRKGLDILLITKTTGGQLLNTNLIDNYLGFNNISGEKLSHAFMEHIISLDVPLLDGVNVEKITKENNQFKLVLDDKQIIETKTVIIATGGNPRKLRAIGEEALIGKGVSYCAICDGPFYKDKDVLVVGGGNSALEAALDLAKIANSIMIVQLEESFTADKILIDQIIQTKNIRYSLNSEVKEIIGKDETVEQVKYVNRATGEESFVAVDGVFIEIGVIPNNSLIKELVELNRFGEIIVDNDQMSSLSGMFAVGDVTDFPYKQIITAASQGAVAALSANNYINKKEQEK